ncbi:hypothetical protein ACHAW5_002944 [Stephanodiscus triporus]|uniref:RNA polymerase II assembly factor Rtp1 C-terminal domain-containing protein n=1 Tax=Stephanodiscus triporus TaxID=2934178 RepID=A0ABD3Q895_9STRA
MEVHSPEPTQPSVSTATDPKEWEERSTQVLSAIRLFVDGLRSAPDLKLLSQSTTTKDEKVASHNRGSLLVHLNSIGVIRKVQELQELPEKPYPSEAPIMNMQYASLGSLLRQHYDADERKQILYHAIFPLLSHLEQCYCILDAYDNLPRTHPEEGLSTIQSQTSTTNNRRKISAPPPIGMLSLNDYTNVACLLEFAVSISLIPLLEYPDIYLPKLATSKNDNQYPFDVHIHKIDRHTTFASQKRNQALPKSLAGRISKTVLTWGTICAADNHGSLLEKLLMFRTQPLRASQHDSKDIYALHRLHQIYRTFHAYNEITILATTVGRLLLLDRFRPMLLPRHLSDVYLCLLIAERLRWYLSKVDNYVPCNVEDIMLAKLLEREETAEIWNSERLHVLQKTILMFPLEFPSSFISATTNPPPQKVIDCREAAVAYRTVLSGGASMIISGVSKPIPSWLRLRLGQCLSKLAQEDLQAVVEVFVAYSCGPGGDNNANAKMNDDIMTGASARLACALCAKPTTAHDSSLSKRKFVAFQEKLCTQFVNFLVAEGEAYAVGLKSNAHHELAQSRSTVAMHLTLWATFAQLPIETLNSFFFARLISGLIPGEQVQSQEPSSYHLSAMQSMAAIVIWLCRVPFSLDLPSKKKVQALLLKSCMPSYGHLTIVGQTLRLAASFSRASLVVEINGKDVGDEKILAILVEKALAKMIGILGQIPSCRDQLTTVALDLLMTVSANQYDKEGYCFEKAETQHIDGDKISPFSNKMYRRSIGASSDIDLPQLIGAIECRVKCLVGAMSALSELNDDRCNMNELTSTMFRLALLLHYSNTTKGGCDDHSVIHTFALDEVSESEGYELRMAASLALGTMSETLPPSSLLGSDMDDIESDTIVLAILGLIINSAAVRMNDIQEKSAEAEESGLFSTVSIVLNLLITLLELGAEKRSMSDETFFKSILPSLEVIASGKMEGGSSEILMVPELAEMASHAMALIVSRGEIAPADAQKTPLVINTKSRLDTILTTLSQAECDLQSSHPPLRARGVVSLRHLAHSLVNNGKGCIGVCSSDMVKRKAVITPIYEPAAVPAKILSSDEELSLISRTLAKICLNALADPESYVYLASIQTLVAVSDVCPSDILPLMGEVIARGQVDISVVSVDANAAFVELLLTPEQRIKAIEALIFIIRRRGDGIFIHGSSLLDTMLFGAKKDRDVRDPKLGTDGQTAHLILRQTHLYFVGATSEAVNDCEDEKKIRLNTGGPIFSMEETDVLRAGAISVVCELISMLNPTTVASYCHVLVKLATDALQLDASRPIRRIAACLARDLYNCVMREATSSSGGNKDCTSSMAVAIVDADEENLYNILTRCVSADELAMIERPILDPATQSRSQEAINIRLVLEAMGVLQAAAVIVHSMKMELNNPVIQCVRRAISRSSA